MKKRLQKEQGGMRRINFISDDSDSNSDMVLQVEGDGSETFTIKGLICVAENLKLTSTLALPIFFLLMT